MGLSSNIIWHQTNLDGFKAIMKSRELTCSYSLETFLNKDHKIAIPMVSLSDIPLADIGEYLDQYGGYLFGFSRQWVIENGFNPVWYCEKSNSAMVKHKKLLFDSFKEKKEDAMTPIVTLLLYYSSYMKDIEGELYVKSKNCTYSNYRFYDEREYRFVPDFDTLIRKNIAPILNEDSYKEYKVKNGNARIDISIPFKLSDLEMIIVKTEKQSSGLQKAFNTKDPSLSVHVFSHEEIKQNIIGTGHQIIKETVSK